MKKFIFSLVVLCILPFIPSVLARDIGWPMFQQNCEHTGKSDVLAAQSGNVSWSLNFSNVISPFCGPTIGEFNGIETIFLGAGNSVYLVSLYGTLLDSIPTSAPVTTVVTIRENVIYFGFSDSLIAYSPSGKLWSVFVGGNVSHQAITDNALYICAADKLYSFDLEGNLNWQTDVLGGGLNHSAPALDQNGNIYVATLADFLAWYDWRLYSFNPDGSQRWMYESFNLEPGGIQISPSIDEYGNIYVATCYTSGWWSGIYSISEQGELNWRRDTEILYSSPAIDDSAIYCVARQTVEARNNNGDLLWQFPVSSLISYSSPAIGSNLTIYVGTDAGKVLALASEGTLKWQCDLHNGPLSSPAIGSDGGLYIASSTALFAFKDFSAVDVGEENAQCCFQIYPNPCRFGKIWIGANCQLGEDSGLEICLFNIKGELAYQSIFSGQCQHKIEVESLASGCYFLKCKFQNYSEVHKIIILK